MNIPQLPSPLQPDRYETRTPGPRHVREIVEEILSKLAVARETERAKVQP